jgi:hypothetical protein
MLPIRTLCLSAVTMGLALSGCVGGNHHDPYQSGPSYGVPSGTFAVAWDLEWVGSTRLISCQEAGAAWVDLDMLDRNNQQYHERFNCSDNQQTGTSRSLYPGDYSVVLRVRDVKERILSSTGAEWFTIVAGTTTYLADSAGNPPIMELQSFYLDWTVSRGGFSASCDSAGAKYVEVIAQLSAETTATSYLLPCSKYVGETPAIPVGSYTVQVRLVGASGNPLGDEQGIWSDTVVVDGDYRADLGTIDFNVL